MKVIFITPASDLCQSVLYRMGSRSTEKKNCITGPLILGHILRKPGMMFQYMKNYENIDYSGLGELMHIVSIP